MEWHISVLSETNLLLSLGTSQPVSILSHAFGGDPAFLAVSCVLCKSAVCFYRWIWMAFLVKWPDPGQRLNGIHQPVCGILLPDETSMLSTRNIIRSLLCSHSYVLQHCSCHSLTLRLGELLPRRRTSCQKRKCQRNTSGGRKLQCSEMV